MDWGHLMQSRERLTLEMDELERQRSDGSNRAVRSSFYDDLGNSKEDETWYSQFQENE